jgi:hypothetical protein
MRVAKCDVIIGAGSALRPHRLSVGGSNMKSKLVIITGALAVIGAAPAGALYYADPVQVSIFGGCFRIPPSGFGISTRLTGFGS